MDVGILSRYLLLGETKNITAAAERSYMSRQAFAESMIKLEDELSVKLFIRHKKGFELTPAGEELMTFLAGWLPEWEKEKTVLSNIENRESKTITIGVSFANLGAKYIDRIIRYEKLHENTKVIYTDYAPEEAFGLLERQEIDIVCVLDMGDITGCLRKRLPETGTEPLLMMHESHPLAVKDVIYCEDLRGYGMVLSNKNMKPDSMLDRYATPFGAIPIYIPVRNETYSLNLMKERKAVGLSSARNPNRFEAEGFVRKPLAYYPLDLSCYVYYRKNSSPAVKDFIDFFTK